MSQLVRVQFTAEQPGHEAHVCTAGSAQLALKVVVRQAGYWVQAHVAIFLEGIFKNLSFWDFALQLSHSRGCLCSLSVAVYFVFKNYGSLSFDLDCFYSRHAT